MRNADDERKKKLSWHSRFPDGRGLDVENSILGPLQINDSSSRYGPALIHTLGVKKSLAAHWSSRCGQPLT